MFGFGGGGFAQAASPDADMWEDFPGSPGGARRPAVKGRIVGKVTEWKGRYGWLIPDEPINHPEARMKGGKIFLSQDDVAEVISGVDAHVSFYVYCDGTGLGAMLCVPSDSPTASKPLQKNVTRAMPKPKPKAKATPGRKRVSETQLSGKVKSWRGGFGFVTPNESVDHPLFTGSLFLHKGDILTPESIDVGRAVTFFLYADPQGLGAEECSVTEGDAAGSASPSSPLNGQTVDIHSSSTLLRARSKASPGSPPANGLVGFTAPTAKAKAMLRATAKAAPGVGRGDPDLASKMAGDPELAKRLSAWMFDPGG